jgi:hypothetical protein
MSSLPLDDVQQVLLILAILYVVECSWWVRGACRRLFAAPFAAWSDLPPDLPEADAWRLGFSNPLPWMAAYSGENFPFPFSGEALLIPIVDASTGREQYQVLPFSSMARVSASETHVLVDGQSVGSFSSRAFADITASRLERIRSVPVDERAHVADRVLAEMHDVAQAADRLNEWLVASAGIRVCGGLLAIVAIGLGPLVWTIRASLPASVPLGVLVVAVVLWACTAVLSLAIPSRVLADVHNTVGHRLIAFLSPATAMRLHDTLGRDVLVRFSPLVIALLGTMRRCDAPLASCYLRASIYPTHLPEVEHADEADRELAARALRWFHDRTAFHSRYAVTASGRDPEVLLTVVAPEPGVESYCPRCARTFIKPVGVCWFCQLPLAGLASTAASSDTQDQETAPASGCREHS